LLLQSAIACICTGDDARHKQWSFIMRKEFEITEEELAELLEACRPTPAMYLSGGTPMFETPQENANRAWRRLGEKKGFDSMTVEPVSGKGQRFFTAVPVERAA
jgi:hypothetical protein